MLSLNIRSWSDISYYGTHFPRKSLPNATGQFRKIHRRPQQNRPHWRLPAND